MLNENTLTTERDCLKKLAKILNQALANIADPSPFWDLKVQR